jgi:hypothetical protein
MSARASFVVGAMTALAALWSLTAGGSLLVALVLVAVAVGFALVPLARWRPERVALVLALAAVAGGTAAASVRVADGIADSRVELRGKLDVDEVLSTFHPAGRSGLGDPMPQIRRLGYGYMSSGQAVVTVPRPSSSVLALWSIQELMPWLLAAIVLALLIPILRAAERGDPFWEGATRRLATIGVLLLVGIPAIAVLQYVAAEAASEGSFVAPMVEPTLSLSLLDVLPGMLTLALAGVFRRGVELRDLDRHTI